jgi:hypothetical protein
VKQQLTKEAKEEVFYSCELLETSDGEMLDKLFGRVLIRFFGGPREGPLN